MKKKCFFEIIIISIIFSGCSIINFHPIDNLHEVNNNIINNSIIDSIAHENQQSTLDEQGRSQDENTRVFSQVYENPENCQPPCFWGIVPGKTTWDSIEQSLSTYGEVLGPKDNGLIKEFAVVIEYEENVIPITARFWVKNGIVVAITANSQWVYENFDFSMSGIINDLGEPEEIWISSFDKSDDDQPYYYLILWYPSRGVLVKYEGNAFFSEEKLSICPKDIFNRVSIGPWMVLWNPEIEVDFEQFGLVLLGDNLGIEYDMYKPINEMSIEKITSKEFVEMVLGNDDVCFLVKPNEH